ncbi:hypothetical protein HK100_004114 [Physocladia obscura]|uniref:Chloride channel protein n=1 Tax=Physocladia obscura TaxID=109957 RepID=A0AAD5ST91_9FUNG|nr:hypothetical protein HK100_004114 [Physocladia obscura]
MIVNTPLEQIRLLSDREQGGELSRERNNRRGRGGGGSGMHQRSHSHIGIGLSRRATTYHGDFRVDDDDPDARTAASNSNGRRAWYPDYSTIDWVHDGLKERARIRLLRSNGSRLANILDSAQGWLLLLATGLFVGAVASAIDISESLLQQFRESYCVEWSLSKNASSFCNHWVSYSDAFGPSLDLPLYIITGVLFAIVSALVTNLSVVSRPSDVPGGKPQVKYQAAGGGIAEVKTILGGFVIRGFLGFKTLATKAVGLTLAIAAGLTLGQQGPLVHIACCIGNILARFFPKYAKNEGKRREMLSAASAAGVSVAFAAPIGGVLFSLEEVSYYFPMKTLWRTFFCSCMAAVTLKVLNPFGSGKLVKFQVTYSRDWVDSEIFPFILLGVAGGIYGALFIRISAMWARVKKYFAINPIVEVAFVAIVTAIVNHRSRFMRLSVNEIVGVLFSECKNDGTDDLYGLCKTFDKPFQVVSILLSLLATKLLLTFFTFGIRVPGGFFATSMLIGACMGRIVGVLVLQFQQLSEIIGIYALVGGAAALAGITRSTVSLAIIMVELTGALKLVIPIMVESPYCISFNSINTEIIQIAVMVSKWTADSITSDSMYETNIKNNKYPYLDHKSEHHPPRGTTRAIASAANVAESSDDFQVDREYSWQEIWEKLNQLSAIEDSGFAVLKGRKLVGYIAYQDLHYVATTTDTAETPTCSFRYDDSSGPQFFNRTDLTPWMDQAPLSVSSRASMDLVVELFMKVGCKVVCVTDVGGRFEGVLTKKRVIAWLSE